MAAAGTQEGYLVTEKLVKRFDEAVAVDEVSLSIGKGEIFALLGSSGCGKSTLLRMLAGFGMPTSGRIFLVGKDIAALPPYVRPINMMFQSYALFPHLTVWDNAAFGQAVPDARLLPDLGPVPVANDQLEPHDLHRQEGHPLRLLLPALAWPHPAAHGQDVLRQNPVEFVKLYAWNIIQPTGVLWFVHMLAVFYVITRLLARVPKWIVFGAAAALQIAHHGLWIDTDSYVLNRAMDYYVYFFLGYAIHGLVFDVADRARARPWVTLAVITGWAICNYWLVVQGFHNTPGYGLMMGLAGALAIVEIAALLSKCSRGALPPRYYMPAFQGFLW